MGQRGGKKVADCTGTPQHWPYTCQWHHQQPFTQHSRTIPLVCRLLLILPPMNRFRKAAVVPFTASQFRLSEPNATSFSATSSAASALLSS